MNTKFQIDETVVYDDATALVKRKEEKETEMSYDGKLVRGEYELTPASKKESTMEKQVEKFTQDAVKMKVEIVPLFDGDPLTFFKMFKLQSFLRLQDEFSKYFDETLYCLYFPNSEDGKMDCHFFVHSKPIEELSSWINSAENFISGFMHGVEL